MLFYLLIIIFAVGFAFLAWRNLVFGVSFVVLLLPSYLIRFSVGPVPMTLLELMVVVLFVIFIIKKWRSWTLTYSNYKWLIIGLLFFATVAVFTAPDKVTALGIWKAYFVEPIMFFLVFINLIKKKEDLEKIFYALGVSALTVASYAIYQKITGFGIINPEWQAVETRRVVSFFGFPNAVGLYLAPIVVLFGGKCWLAFRTMLKRFGEKSKFFLLHKKGLSRKAVSLVVFNLAVVITGLLAIYFARSEGAMVAVLIGLVCLGLFLKELRPITLATILIALMVFTFVPTVNDYVMNKATFSDFSGNVRQVMWQETIQMLKASPILGAGLAGYQQAITPFHHSFRVTEVYLYPHQLILNFWTELGLLGLITMLVLVVKFFTNYLKVRKSKAKEIYLVLMATFMAVLAHGLVDVPYLKNDLAIFWWLLFGLSWLVIKRANVFIGKGA